ncbi:MAG: hypothetical protein ABI683_03380 [Ginsengibacter sp.]
MKKNISMRLLTVCLLVMAATATIQSETKVCSVQCSASEKDATIIHSNTINEEQQQTPAYPYETFFIKI